MQMRQVRIAGSGGKRLGIFGFDFDLPGLPGFPGIPAPGAPAPAAPAPAAPAAPAAAPEAGPSMEPAFLFPTAVQQAPAPAPTPAPTPAAPGMSTETVLIGAGVILGVVALVSILK